VEALFMGTQGEIYNILGVKVPVKEKDKGALYEVGNKTVWVDSKYYGKADIEDGFGGLADITKPKLNVKILHVDHEFGIVGTNIEALIGYAIANESYIAHAKVLPNDNVIKKLKPKVVADIKSTFGLEVKLDNIKLYLLYEFAQ
jgi:hypothetical protein